MASTKEGNAKKKTFRPGKKGGNNGGKAGGKKGGKRFVRKESRIDKEIKEIEKLSARLSELAALPEEERVSLKKFEELPLSQYTKTGRWCNVVFDGVGLKEAGFTEMTEIQESSILPSLQG